MPNTTPLTARPTTYKGVQMRSRLEARYAQWLDSLPVEWHYEPQCFASDAGQYLPDFRLDGIKVVGYHRPVFVEVKPNTDFLTSDPHAWARWSSIIRESIPDAVLVLDIASMPRPVVALPLLNDVRYFDGQWVMFKGLSLAAAVVEGWRE